MDNDPRDVYFYFIIYRNTEGKDTWLNHLPYLSVGGAKQSARSNWMLKTYKYPWWIVKMKWDNETLCLG